MFRLDTIEHIRTFSGPEPVVLFPKVVTFAEDGTVLIAGTDKGRAVVFDVTSGAKIQHLKYNKGGLVQPVAVSTSLSCPSIAEPEPALGMHNHRRVSGGYCRIDYASFI